MEKKEGGREEEGEGGDGPDERTHESSHPTASRKTSGSSWFDLCWRPETTTKAREYARSVKTRLKLKEQRRERGRRRRRARAHPVVDRRRPLLRLEPVQRHARRKLFGVPRRWWGRRSCLACRKTNEAPAPFSFERETERGKEARAHQL